MTPTRRTFTALLAASAVALPRLSVAQGVDRTGTVKTKDGVELFVKDTGGNGRAIVLTHAWPLNADIWNYQSVALSKAGYRSELAAVKVPTLMLHGTTDIPVSFDQAKATAAGIAGSKLIACHDASYGIVVTERDRVTNDLKAFLAS
jgi:pimeloyl-ACP methyl ester carboxylesterase